jgi:hypothetical protein
MIAHHVPFKMLLSLNDPGPRLHAEQSGPKFQAETGWYTGWKPVTVSPNSSSMVRLDAASTPDKEARRMKIREKTCNIEQELAGGWHKQRRERELWACAYALPMPNDLPEAFSVSVLDLPPSHYDHMSR